MVRLRLSGYDALHELRCLIGTLNSKNSHYDHDGETSPADEETFRKLQSEVKKHIR